MNNPYCQRCDHRGPGSPTFGRAPGQGNHTGHGGQTLPWGAGEAGRARGGGRHGSSAGDDAENSQWATPPRETLCDNTFLTKGHTNE